MSYDPLTEPICFVNGEKEAGQAISQLSKQIEPIIRTIKYDGRWRRDGRDSSPMEVWCNFVALYGGSVDSY